MGAWLRDRLPEHVDVAAMLEAQRFVDEDGRAVREDDPYAPHRFVWFHRDLRDEPEVAAPIHVVHHDERLVVVDKPPFLSSIPRGRHVMQSVVVRLRAELGLPDLSPLHRLDRVTSGLLMLATERQWRGPYQSLFEHRAAVLVDEALRLEHRRHVHVLRQPVPQPGAHRGPLVRARPVAVGGPQPGGVETVPGRHEQEC